MSKPANRITEGFSHPHTILHADLPRYSLDKLTLAVHRVNLTLVVGRLGEIPLILSIHLLGMQVYPAIEFVLIGIGHHLACAFVWIGENVKLLNIPIEEADILSCYWRGTGRKSNLFRAMWL